MFGTIIRKYDCHTQPPLPPVFCKPYKLHDSYERKPIEQTMLTMTTVTHLQQPGKFSARLYFSACSGCIDNILKAIKSNKNNKSFCDLHMKREMHLIFLEKKHFKNIYWKAIIFTGRPSSVNSSATL